MNFATVCSGIGAPEVAWLGLGWVPIFVSEVERFPSAVLAHHHPGVPNLGDFTTIGDEYAGSIDVLAAGTPCQDFSVAGLRAGMDGKRGQLTVEYAHLAHRLGSRWLVWENVPGVLSIDGGEAFATFLGLLCGHTVSVPGGGWSNSGVIAGAPGSYGLAYRVLDAQYCGVPQRHRRVFVVGYFGDWRRAAAVLFERHSLSGHPPPSREARESFTHELAPSLTGSGRGTERTGESRGQDPVVATLDASYARLQGASGQDANHGHSHLIAYGGNNTSGSIDVATACNAHAGRMDFETETETVIVTHALRAEGFDASEDGTGRGTPLVPVTIQAGAVRENSDSGPDGVGVRTDGIAYTLEARAEVQAVMTLAIRGREGEPTLEVREDGIANAVLTPNGGRGGIGVGAVAISANQRGEIRERPVHGSLSASKSAKQFDGIMSGMAVRRLTPMECERLQGFKDGYTKIKFHKVFKSGRVSKKLYIAADGPRYKALGNSMAIPCMRWIGERIDMVEQIAPVPPPMVAALCKAVLA